MRDELAVRVELSSKASGELCETPAIEGGRGGGVRDGGKGRRSMRLSDSERVR